MMALLLSLLVSAQGDLASQVHEQLSNAPVQKGTFTQQKQIKGFKRPLKSNGIYTVTKGQGILWNTLSPFPSELTVKADEISSKQGTTEVFRLDAKTEPTVRVITHLLFSLLAGDLEGLESYFTATGKVSAEGWTIVLVPKVDTLKKTFTRISLEGDTSVRSVRLFEFSGDETNIALTPEIIPGKR